MSNNWDRTLFDRDLKTILETKLPVSASKITGLQRLATDHPKHHNYIVQCITRFIETAPPDYRLAGLYVIDAISRVVHKQQRKREENNEGPTEAEGYLKRFAFVLKEDSLIGCFEPCTAKDKDKVKKTLDFWEQGNVYSKDVVQYVKASFLDSASLATMKGNPTQQAGKGTPPVDAAMLLATLSNIGNGTLSNLNIPGLASIVTPTPAAAPPSTVEVPEILPPALAKLLGGLVTNPSPPPTQITHQSSTADPRMRANSSGNSDPRQRSSNWPVPQGPSIPTPSSRPERKSRWGNANEAPSSLNSHSVSPSQQQGHSSWNPHQEQASSNTYHQSSNKQFQPQQYQQQHQPKYQAYQMQPSYQQQQQHQQPRAVGAEPVHDPTLPSGCIKVLTRSLFVGPIPDDYRKEDVAHIFNKYGDLASVVVSTKLKGRHNAFLKFTTRASTEAAKFGSSGLVVESVPVKVNWAFGFGPKKHFNYDRGDSIIPLAELNDEEKNNLMTAPVGGFQGQPVRELMTVEEPEAQYRPEWKNNSSSNNNNHGNDFQQRGFKRQQGSSGGANFEEINNTRKKSRFNNEDNYGMNSPPLGYQDQQRGQPFYGQQYYDPSVPTDNLYFSNNNQ